MRIEINEVNDRTEQVWFVILASIVAMVIGCIIAIFVAFIGVGILVLVGILGYAIMSIHKGNDFSDKNITYSIRR